MSLNIFGSPGSRRVRVRSTVGVAIAAVAATGAFGSGAPAAEAAPRLAVDPVPMPGGPVAGVGAANGIFQMLNSLLDSMVPGAGSIMPSPTSLMPGQAPALPGRLPAVPGRSPGLPGQPVPHAPTGQRVV